MKNSGLTLLIMLLPAVLPASGMGHQHFDLIREQQSRLFQSDSIRTEQHYFQSLAAADETTFQFQFETEFLLLLDDPRLQEYQKLPSLLAKKRYIIDYWKASNPNPLLDENDWLKDFLQRRRYVRRHFAISRPPYFDDRGKYYLKYGKPFRRYVDPAGYQRVDLNSVLSGVRIGQAAERYITIRLNESWSYENIRRNFVVHFMKDGEGFREIDDLIDVVEFINGRGKYDVEVLAQIWYSLLLRRSYLSHGYQVAQDKMRWIQEGREHLKLGYDQVLATPYFIKDEYEKSRRLAIKEAPHVAYEPVDAVNRLKFLHRIHQFSAGRDQTRLVIDFWWPIPSRTLKQWEEQPGDSFTVAFSALFRDSTFNEADRQAFHLRGLRADVLTQKKPVLSGSVQLVVPVQNGELTVQIEDRILNQLGFERRTFAVRDFRSPELQISDVRFLAEPAAASGFNFPQTVIDGRKLISYPFPFVQRALPSYIYFEIYHLPETSGERYEVEYKIRFVGSSGNVVRRFLGIFSGKKSAISVRNERPILKSTARERLMLDWRQLKSGRYRMEITVRVSHSAELARTTYDFELR